MLRNVIFWLHLTAGVFAGLVVLVMSVTGVLLTYEVQLLQWGDQGLHEPAPADAKPLPIARLVEAATKVETKAAPTAVTFSQNPAAPATVHFGRRQILYINAYTGLVLGEGSQGVREFVRVNRAWHRWLGGDTSGWGKQITGAANIAFAFIIVSGLFLWFPRKWRGSALRPILWFKRGLPAKTREWNWHNVIGFWCCVPLLLIVLSGVFIGYDWAKQAVAKAVGAPPAASRPAPPRLDEASLADADSVLAAARTFAQDWTSLRVELPTADGPVTVIADRSSTGRQPQLRTTYAVDPATAQPVSTETFADLTLNERVRWFLRYVHTGEFFGLLGQTIAGIATLGAVFLVYTGLSLSIRRFFSWRSRGQRRRAGVEVVETEAAASV